MTDGAQRTERISTIILLKRVNPTIILKLALGLNSQNPAIIVKLTLGLSRT
jgi:hypothetical protein